MTTYIIRRIIQAIFVVLIVSVVVFCIIRLLPGDPILIYLSGREFSSLTSEQIEAARHQYGIDRPLVVQYFSWWNDMLHGDMGSSLFYNEKVSDLMAERIPVTLHLGISAFLLSCIVGVFIGIITAIRRATVIDTFATFLANIGICVPIFWLGILLLYLFGLKLHVLPLYGYTSPFTDFWMSTKQAILPVICLSIFSVAAITRQTRSSVLETIRQDYVRTAWSKGFKESYIVSRHVLKNSLIPIITLLGLAFSNIMGGSVLIESVFSVPGLGRLAVNALFDQDYEVIQAITLFTSALVVGVNLCVDIAYGWLDPRIRYA
jgi:peptide/nickel transport system permease protein